MWIWENISENHKEIKFFKVPASIISSCIQFKSGYKNCNSGTSIVSSDKLLLTFKQRNNVFRNDVKYIGNDSYFLTVVIDESEEWSSQLISNLSNRKEEAWKKIRASTGFEPVTSGIPVRCSTNWAMKPHIGSEVNLLRSYLPVQWNDVKFIWNMSYLYCGCRWKWRVIIAVNFPI